MSGTGFESAVLDDSAGQRAQVSGAAGSVSVYHNILWAKYKGVVFTALNASAKRTALRFSFIQIAETEGVRAGLSAVDTRFHDYPYQLLFRGRYDSVPTYRLALTLAAHVFKSDADLVVLPGYHRVEYWAMLLACQLRGKRCAVFCDSTRFDQPASRIKSFLKSVFFRRCDALFGYGLRSGEYLIENGARPDAVYYGCQAAALPLGFEAGAALAARLAARRADPQPTFLYLGRLSGEKGLDTLLDAFALYLRRGKAGRLVLVGSGTEEPALRARADALGITANVAFEGPKETECLPAYFAAALCLVLPSTSEPWGLVVNEGLHHGCPAIVSEVCGCRPDLIVDGQTGLAFAPSDAQGLSDCLEAACQAFADTDSVARRCQALIANFTPERAARQILRGCSNAVGMALR